MNDKSVQVLEQYGIEVEKTRRGRGALLVDTDTGCYRLSVYKGSIGRLIYEEELMNKIAELGDIPVNAIIRNQEGELFSSDSAGVKYILNRHFTGNEYDARNCSEMHKAAQTLAHLHNRMTSMKLENAQYIPVLNSNLEEMKRHNAELKRICGFIRKKTGKTEFEYDILKHFDEFYELASETERRCLDSGYEEANAQAVANTDICHGNYSYHNLIHMEHQVAVINFEHSGSGMLIRDFAFFLRKVMEKHDWNQEFGEELIGAYDNIRTISPIERETLEILLTYPEKFWKVLNHYYNRNKAYLPDQMRDKLHKVCQQQKNKNQFIKAIFH